MVDLHVVEWRGHPGVELDTGGALPAIELAANDPDDVGILEDWERQEIGRPDALGHEDFVQDTNVLHVRR